MYPENSGLERVFKERGFWKLRKGGDTPFLNFLKKFRDLLKGSQILRGTFKI